MDRYVIRAVRHSWFYEGNYLSTKEVEYYLTDKYNPIGIRGDLLRVSLRSYKVREVVNKLELTLGVF